MMHHGIDFLNADDAKKLEHWADDNCIDVVFCGHAHQSALYTYTDTFREIKQITSGAIVIDGYATPSFYVCEYNEQSCDIQLQLYTYALKKEDWVLDNQSLRTFKHGIHSYKLPRKIEQQKNVDIFYEIPPVEQFNKKYFDKYGSKKIYSEKYDGNEDFNSWKIINSLINIGMTYKKALWITNFVVNEITDKDFTTANKLLSCSELRTVVYKSILSYIPQDGESKFEISCWASRYARKYNRDKEISVVYPTNQCEKLNYNYIKNSLLQQVLEEITGNPAYYQKLTGRELCEMSESILSFLKSMESFEIKHRVLLDLVREYMTQTPHPWLVNNNQDDLIAYHIELSKKHVKELKNNPVISSQIEAAYHICATFMTKYDQYIGCDELSPIISLSNAVNWINDEEKFKENKLPILKHKIVQMKKDLEGQSISFTEFQNTLNIIADSLITNRDVTSDAAKKAILKMWDYLRKLQQSTTYNKPQTPLDRINYIFNSADGFVAKKPLQALPNCFWIEPNWEKYEDKHYGLGKQILVCVLKRVEDAETIHSYFYVDKCGTKSTEIVFANENFNSFSQEDRNKVREMFKGEFVRCIFIQQENYQKISESLNWREIFLDVLQRSKIS